MALKEVNGWWFPETETHMSEFIRTRGSYQEQHRKNALSFVKNFGACVEIGGHVGTWGRDFSMLFDELVCFEPMAEFRECYLRNVTEHDWCKARVVMYPYALGDKEENITMQLHEDNTGHSHIDYHSNGGNIPMKMLDSLQLDSVLLHPITFIKCDAEGAEEFIMKGAVKTIEIFKPIICIEQKAQKHIEGVIGYNGQYGAVEFLKTLGMKQVGRVVDDIVMSF